jgi:hypothetical protein
MTQPLCAGGCGSQSAAALCRDCTSALRSALQLAASVGPDLDDAIARLTRHGGSGSGSSEPPLPYDPMASQVTQSLRLALLAAIIAITPGQPFPRGATVRQMATYVASPPRLHALTQHPDVGVLSASIRDMLTRAVRVLDGAPELHPAGTCDLCARPLLAELGADTATCACGATVTGITAARAKRAADADVLGTPDEVSLRLQLAGYTVAPGTIRMLSSRGRLVQRPGGRYSLGDVLEWARERDERMSRGRPV